MARPILRTLLSCVEVIRPALTRPGYANALAVMVGWALTTGHHAVTQALVAADVAHRRHHERFHRFFSRGTWSPDRMGQLLCERALRWAGDGDVQIVLDDTLAPKKGPHVFGIGSHLDAVRSTKKFRVFSFGHVWVVLSLVVRVPFSSRPWSIPILFRLYRNKTECERKGDAYRKKTEMGRELVELCASWLRPRRIHLIADEAYCNVTLLKGLPEHVVVFGSIRPDAVLTALPTPRTTGAGRPRMRGSVLPKPEALANDPKLPWRRCSATVYSRRRTIHYKTIDAQWYRGSGTKLVRIVVVRVSQGRIALRVFLCTDPRQTIVSILETYARRWSLEVAFRDLKQHLGFSASAARKRAAVERTAPFVGILFSTLVVWFAEGAWRSTLAQPPTRPWYRHKRNASFADILHAAQLTLSDVDVLDPRCLLGNLQQSSSPRSTPVRLRRRRSVLRAA